MNALVKVGIAIVLFFSPSFLSSASKNPPLCISLGSACGSACNLRALGLRVEAYPFDWMLSPSDALFAALIDDFASFFCDLRMRDDKTGVIDRYGFHFTHDLPTITQPSMDVDAVDFIHNNTLIDAWNKAIPAAKEKYERRIERFRKACAGTQKVFFFRAEAVTKQEAVILRDLLMWKFPLLDFTLIVIKQDLSFKEPWNLEKIKNFYVAGWDNAAGWKDALITAAPELKEALSH